MTTTLGLIDKAIYQKQLLMFDYTTIKNRNGTFIISPKIIKKGEESGSRYVIGKIIRTIKKEETTANEASKSGQTGIFTPRFSIKRMKNVKMVKLTFKYKTRTTPFTVVEAPFNFIIELSMPDPLRPWREMIILEEAN